MRKVTAVALSLAFQAAALGAPLVHAHPDRHATEHHEGGAVHVHWAGHAPSHDRSGAPAVGTDDRDRAVFLDAFLAVTASAFPLAAVSPAAFELVVPPERAAHRVIEVVRSHDPPDFRSRPARAPPLFFLS